MNKLLLTAFLAVLTLGQGCIINDYDDDDDGTVDPLPGDITFFWTFQGAMCADVPSVANVRVTIPNEPLENGGVYGCLNGDFAGITLHDFFGGTYNYTLEALSNTGEVLYSADGTLTVDGDVRLDVDLTPTGSPTSFAYLSWSFAANWNGANPSCTDAAIDYVYVEFDESGEFFAYDCEEGMANGGAASPLLAPGTHTVKFFAGFVSGEAEIDVASAESTITTVAHAPASHSFTIQWDVGGTTVAWQLMNGAVEETCAQADVETVYVHFRDTATGDYVYGNDGDPQPCDSATVTYLYLPPGEYEVFTSATAGDDTLYLSPDEGAPEVTVSAGVWTPDEPAVVTVLTERQ